MQTKGGVGKSVMSQLILAFLSEKEIIKVYEVDNNNITNLVNSKLEITNIRLSEAADALDDIFFDDLSNPEIENIIDCGGGDDTVKLMKMLTSQAIENVEFYLPIKMGEDNSNLIQTISMIPKNSNITIVCMGYSDKEKIKNEFM